MAKETKDVAVKETALFPILENSQRAIEALHSNLEGQQLSPMDLDRVSIPTGGGTTWAIPGLEKEEVTQELLGVMCGVQNCRAYWKGDFSGGGDPPDCSSDDGRLGVGDPGGDCSKCPLAEFGSKEGRKSQACRAIKRLYVIRPGSVLPIVVNIPPSSLKAATKYLLRLSSAGLKYQGVVTRLTLEKTKSSEGIAYSQVLFGMAAALDPAQVQAMEEYVKAMGPLLQRPVAPEDFKD